MSITVYYNPNCSTCSKAVEFIRAKSIEPMLIDYLKNGLEYTEVKKIFLL